MGVLSKVHGAIRDIGNVKNIVNSVQYLLSVYGKSALHVSSIWISLNSSRSGMVTDIMRRTRCKYHYAIRKKNKNLKLRKEAMANAKVKIIHGSYGMK